MRAPRLFLGATLLFWGWMADTLWVAAFLALVLESAQLVQTRFEYKPSDFNKFVDISIMLLAGTVVIALTIEAQKALLILLKWLPAILFPIMAAQQYSAAGKIDLQSFFIMIRKKTKQQFYEPQKINISYMYAFFVILSAGSTNIKGPAFFIGICLFAAWALWQTRSKRYSPAFWMLCIIILIVSGYATHVAVRSFSHKLNHWIMERYANYYSANPFKSTTALGDIGELKFSNKIILRVWPNNDLMPGKTYLLHNASYNKFAGSNWFSKSQFTAITPEKNQTFWQINPPAVPNSNPDSKLIPNLDSTMTVYSRPIKNKAVLSLPSGVISLSEMKAEACEKNQFQAVRIEGVPNLIKSNITYSNQLSYDAEPDKTDLFIPEKELPGIIQFTQDLLLKDKSDQEILDLVKHYFSTRFTYSLDLNSKGRNSTPLQNFLLYTRSGHCEFFATATALILRQVGIPTRYATGYIAHEYSKLSNHLVVRHRDAHAWTKVYINGQWKNFDTTPPSFLQIDSKVVGTSWLRDLASFLGFKLSQLRHETGKDLMNQYGLWLILPLGLILFFRLQKAGNIKRIQPSSHTSTDKRTALRDDAFLTLETVLAQSGFSRHPFETGLSWCNRIIPLLESKNIKDDFQTILKTYYHHRFSRSGLTKTQKIRLDADIKTFLNRLKGNRPV
ncbi:MAG: transglutaminase-like domain-containing protein [Pseudomonadota bacterium]